jgi:5-formyltetrahydrofolate cyclo-ligase
MSITPIKRAKDLIRAEFSARRNALDENERAQRSARICATVENLVSFKHADIILLYAPIKSEIDVMQIAVSALEKGKRVAFPRCDTETRTMKFHFITSFDDFEIGAYGIREPKEELEIYDPETTLGSAVCFLPGLAFDVYGYRLGYGKGYYDKFLHIYKGCTIGVTYTELIAPSLPRGKFDIPCNIMLTEKGIKQIKPLK